MNSWIGYCLLSSMTEVICNRVFNHPGKVVTNAPGGALEQERANVLGPVLADQVVDHPYGTVFARRRVGVDQVDPVGQPVLLFGPEPQVCVT